MGQGQSGEHWTLEVTDLKQYAHCPRIVYYRYVLPQIRPVTALMREGQTRHREESAHEDRRSLRPYGLVEGERFFDVRLHSTALGLRGCADMVIATPDRGAEGAALVVVEYKMTERRVLRNWKLQLGAYALLLEEAWGLPVVRGYVYHIGERRSEAVAITAAVRRQVQATVMEINGLIAGERLPEPPRNMGVCVSCEFRRFCNDVV